MSDAKTISVYDAKAGEYANFTLGADNPHLAQFVTYLPKGAAVLDLGCGPGAEARAMIDLGLDVTAVDASEEMIRLASAVEGLKTAVRRFDEITETDAYDGIWASFSLLHAPRADMPGHLAALKRALRSDGVLYIGLKTGAGARTDKLGRFYTYYEPDEIADYLTTAGFSELSRDTFETRGMAGDIEPCVAIYARG